MADPVVFITPTSISPTGDSTWRSYDCTSLIPGGFSASGVLLRYRWTSATSQGLIGFRRGDSTDTRRFEGHADTVGAWEMAAIGLDSADDTFDYNAEHSGVQIQVVGFFDSTHVKFFQNATEFTPGAAVYADVDISSATGGDTAVAAIFQIESKRAGAAVEFAWRSNGSSDDIYERPGAGFDGNQVFNGCGMVIVGVDGSEICEWKQSSSFGGASAVLVGYFVSGITWNTTASDVSTATTGSWQPISIGSGPVAAYVEMLHTSGTEGVTGGLSTDGSADDTSGPAGRYYTALLDVNASNEVEQYISDTNQDVYLRATFQDTGGGGGSSIAPIAMRQYRQRRMM